MGRGLDGFLLIPVHWRCVVLKAREERSSPPWGRGPRGLDKFPVAMARGKHLFPFRTEPLSPSAPMVLGPQGPGRVGRRRFFYKSPAFVAGFLFGGGGGSGGFCSGPATVPLAAVRGRGGADGCWGAGWTEHGGEGACGRPGCDLTLLPSGLLRARRPTGCVGS